MSLTPDALESLVDRVAAGDREALAALHDQTAGRVYAVALRRLRDQADAEDVALETFVHVWHNAARYDPRRGSVLSWLAMLARSRSFDLIRRRNARQRRERPLAEAGMAPSRLAGPEDAAAADQFRRRLLGALARLPREQREAIELAFFRGLSHSDVARAMDVPLGTVKTRIRNGLIRLRGQLLAPRGTRDAVA